MVHKAERMTRREKLGQRFAVGFPETYLSEAFKSFLAEYKIGNIILFGNNVESDAQLAALCRDIQTEVRKNTGQDAFIMIDQEGGAIVRLQNDGVNVPGAMAVAATGKPDNAYLAGRLTGKELRSLGVNFDLAPDMDVNCNPDNPVIGIRSYGDRPEQAAEYGIRMMQGLLEEKVLSCAKHFPGHGDTGQDTHLSLPKVDKTEEELLRMELYPFMKAIEAGIPAVMTTHILFPALEKRQVPATMSKAILTDLLRGRFGFQGMILSDCMEMGAIKEYYGTPQGVLAAMQAGVDIVLISHTAATAAESIKVLEEAADSGKLTEENIDGAVGRILAFKERYAGRQTMEEEGNRLGRDNAPEREKAYRLLKATITPAQLPDGGIPSIGKNPFFAGCYAYRATLAANEENKSLCFSEWMAEAMGGSACIFSPDPDEDEIGRVESQAEGHTGIVIGTYNGHLRKGQKELVARLSKQQVPVIVFALRNPYDLKQLPENVTGIAAWEYSVRSFRAIREILEDRKVPEGNMPIAW